VVGKGGDVGVGWAGGATTETLPLFPLGGIVYTPNSEHVLNIFEPRYRQMYNDILMNGSKRFVVTMCHPAEEGQFASVGVLFSLEELKEVSEMTGNRVKYICNHRVTGRVRLHEILNPDAWESRDTYLKVRGTIIDDTGGGGRRRTTRTRTTGRGGWPKTWTRASRRG
jgi:Lon protease-like protein